MGDGIWILFLEAGLALGLFVFIVWWTLPRRSAAGVAGDAAADVTTDPAAQQERDRHHG
jgi:hypothetical protein